MKREIRILIIKYLRRSMRLMKNRNMVLGVLKRVLIRKLIKRNHPLNLVRCIIQVYFKHKIAR